MLDPMPEVRLVRTCLLFGSGFGRGSGSGVAFVGLRRRGGAWMWCGGVVAQGGDLMPGIVESKYDWKNFWVLMFAQVVSSWSYRWFSLLLGAPYVDVLTTRGKDLRHASPVRWSSVLLSIIDISAPRLHQQVMEHLDGNNQCQLYNVKKGPE